MAAFVRYSIVGGLAFALHLALLQILLLRAACPAWAASAIGFVLACVFNYALQRLWVFRCGRSHAVAALRYVAITTVMLGVNMVLFGLLYRLGLEPVVAQTITTGCVFVLNFHGNRRFTFGGHRAEQVS
jgi:putative flippase GtrA